MSQFRSNHDPESTNQAARATALAALLQSDESANQSVNHAATMIIGFVLAYLAAATFVFTGDTGGTSISALVTLFVPAPPLLLQMIQMIWMQGVMSRAKSTEYSEEELAKLAGHEIHRLYRQNLIGSRSTKLITDIRYGFRATRMTTVAAALPYIGFYLLTFCFTVYILLQTYPKLDRDPTNLRLWVLAAGVYLAFYAIFVIALVQSSLLVGEGKPGTAKTGRLDPGVSERMDPLVALVALVGVTAQMLQIEDKTPAFSYFTVWAATISAIGWWIVAFWGNVALARYLILAGWVGILVSSLAYWLIIFPENGAGTASLTIWANISLHLLLPLVIFLRLQLGQRNLGLPTGWAFATLLFPGIYLSASLLLTHIGSWSSPYTFLRPEESSTQFFGVVALVLIVWCAAVAQYLEMNKTK